MRRKKDPGPIAARAPPWPPSGRLSEYEPAEAEAEAEAEGVVGKITVGDVERMEVGAGIEEVWSVDSCEMLELNLVWSLVRGLFTLSVTVRTYVLVIVLTVVFKCKAVTLEVICTNVSAVISNSDLRSAIASSRLRFNI